MTTLVSVSIATAALLAIDALCILIQPSGPSDFCLIVRQCVIAGMAIPLFIAVWRLVATVRHRLMSQFGILLLDVASAISIFKYNWIFLYLMLSGHSIVFSCNAPGTDEYFLFCAHRHFGNIDYFMIKDRTPSDRRDVVGRIDEWSEKNAKHSEVGAIFICDQKNVNSIIRGTYLITTTC